MGSGAAVRSTPGHIGPGNKLTLGLTFGLTFGTSIKLFSLCPAADRSTYVTNWTESRKVFELDGPMPRLFSAKLRTGHIYPWRRERDDAVRELTYDTLKDALITARSRTNLSAPNSDTNI